MAYYPYFNTAGGTVSNTEASLYLSTSKDNAFDVYKFRDSNGADTVFMLFIIKNTHVDTDSSLQITSISGNDAFDSRFTLNPTDDDGNLLIGFPNDNKAVTPVNNDISGVNVSGVTSPPSDSTGASAYIGHPGSVSNNSAAELNTSGSTFLIPIYTTTNIVNNNIPYNSYASFIVKFTPDSAADTLDINNITPQLYIRNNDTDIVINFEGRIVNPTDFYGIVGTALPDGQAVGIDKFDSSYTMILGDGDTFDLGLFPVNYNYGAENKTIRFYDYSENPGSFRYDMTNGLMKTLETTTEAEGVTTTISSGININSVNNFYSGFKNRFNHLVLEKDCADDSTRGIYDNNTANVNYPQALFKNFEQRSTGPYFMNHPSNISFQGNVGSLDKKHHLYEHAADANAVARLGGYQIKKIVNTLPSVDDDNQIFQFGVRLGYYHPFTFNAAQCDVWKLVWVNELPAYKKCSNVHVLAEINSDGRHPRIASTFNNKPLTRLSTCPLNIATRFNYFHEGSATGAPFTVPSFYFEDSKLIVTGTSTSQAPVSYTTGTDITNKSQIYSTRTGATTFTSSEASNMFDDASAHGTILELNYNISPHLPFSTMYKDENMVKGMYVNPSDSNAYGLFENRLYLSLNADGLWGQAFRRINASHDNAQPRYEYCFYPEYSYARLLSTYSDGVKTRSTNQTPNPLCKLFYDDDAGVNDNTEYNIGTEKITLNSPNDWYPAGATNANQNMSSNEDQQYVDNGPDGDKNAGTFQSGWTINDVMANEGQWYGAGIVSYLRPHAWGFDTGRYANNNMTSSKGRIDHNMYSIYRRGKTGYGAPRWYEENVDYWFKLPSASYNASVGKFRAVGRLYIDNTGDYPIFMQQIEVKTKGFHLANRPGSSQVFSYQNTKEALLPKSYDENNPNTQVFADYKPTADSATPSWGISRGRYHGDQEDSVEVWNDNDTAGLGLNNEKVVFPRHFDEQATSTMDTAANYYITRNNMFDHSANVKSDFSNAFPTNNSDERVMLIQPQKEGDIFTRQSGSVHGVKTGTLIQSATDQVDLGHMNYFDVVFELTPTGTSSDDNGMYYAQVCLTYYVNDHDSRKEHHADASGTVTDTHTQYIGQPHNAHTRLRVSKYLVGVKVETLSEITVVDSESDIVANNSSIDLGDISIG